LERELMDDLLEDQTDALKDSVPEPSIRLEDEVADANNGDTVNISLDSAAQNEPKKTESKSRHDKKTDVESHGDDPTIRLANTTAFAGEAGSGSSSSAELDDQVRSSVGRFGGFRNTTTPTGAALAQSENLRIAQGRILELEREVERLRIENEELAAAGETFRRKSDELKSKADDLDNRYQNAVSTHAQEKTLLLENKDSLRQELGQLKARNEELEVRISTNIQKIRVRERELENRLELVKMEGAALVRSKDEIVLDLKRQIDQLSLELNNYRSKSQELNRMILDKQDILRRTVKALRLALTMLEGDEESSQPVKKAK
jgi:hypothetical protein